MSNTQPEPALYPCLHAVWQRNRSKHISAGLLAMLHWAIPLFALGVAIDRWAYLPATGRIVILAILVGVSLYKAWQQGWQHLRPFNPTHTALEIEKQKGGLDSLLVTAVQMKDAQGSAGTSSAMWEAARSKAEGTAKEIKATEIVDYSILRTPMKYAAGMAALFIAFAVMNGPFLAVGLKRIFNPWTDIAYPTKTQLDLKTGDLVVKEGDQAEILIGVSGVVPENARLYLRTGNGKPRKLELGIQDGLCEYKIASASRDFSYSVRAGDARSDWRQVKVVIAPRIQEVKVGLEFPDYLGRESQEVEALTLTIPQDTQLHSRLILDRPLRKAVLNRDGKEPLELELSDNGMEVSIEEEGEASRGYSFTWVDKDYGFEFTSPRYYLQISSDQAPRVELTSPESNLVAMVGRPLQLTARIQDDHGIGSSEVVYWVNQRNEESVEFELPSSDGQGEQTIAWDYRNTLPDIKVGDVLSFALEVSDLYPGENGPHIVRSETRRMTFLSKEDYLEQIAKQKDRLLSRVQTAYRQQRAAFESVGNLDPNTGDYMQSCQVEAIRQELVREQLKVIAGQLKGLLDDLAANNVSDAPEGESLGFVRNALLDIADTHLADAATRLRHQSGVAAGDSGEEPDPASAARAVNTAARELASLVLLRSIDSAQEVFAREARMLAQVQASLRWRNVHSGQGGKDESLSKEQDELATWTNRLVSDLQEGMSYGRRPLAVLRLIRSLKDLQTDKVEVRMKQAADLIAKNDVDGAEKLQAGLVMTLLDAEFTVRLSGAYSTLVKTRDKLRSIAHSQGLLRKQIMDMPAGTFAEKAIQAGHTQTQLRKRLLTLLLQTVPDPRTQLFDEILPEAPAIHSQLREAGQVMGRAAEQLTKGHQEPAVSAQQIAEQELNDLVNLIDRWTVQLGLETLGLGTLVAATGERVSIIEDFEARVIALLEKTDIAASEGEKVDGLADPQQFLAEELAAFNGDLGKQNQSGKDKDIPPLLSRMERAEKALRAAVASLKANDADGAIGHQEEAADILAGALAVVTTQNEQLGLLQSLLMYQRSVGFANGYMADIVAQQKELAKATEPLEAEDKEKIAQLMPPLGNLRRTLDDIAPLLDMVASRVDAGSPLAFAKADLEDAVAALEDGDTFDAFDAQDVAAESLGEVQLLVKAVRSQAGYVAEIVEFLHNAVSDISMLEYQQEELRLQAGEANPDQLVALVAKQKELLAKAEEVGEVLEEVTGMPAFTEPAEVMQEVMEALDTKDALAAAESMELAEELFLENSESLYAVISMLHGLPNIDVLTHKESEAAQRLVDVLAVATDHKMLFRKTNGSSDESLKALAAQQGKLVTLCEKAAKAGEPHPMLQAASTQLQEAASALLQSTDRDIINSSQKAAMQSLRHFIIEQSLVLETATPPAVAQEGDENAGGEGSDSESAFTAGFIADFVSGEAPKDQRTGWNVRADRNRAALNQNFARELPLEFRGLLKDYYERIAE